MEIKKKLIQNTSINYLSNFINIGLGFVLFPFIIHRVGSELFGIYLLIITLSGYLTMMEVGVGTTTVKYISQHLAKDEKKEINELVINSLLFYILVGFTTAGFLILIAFYFINIFKIPSTFLILTKNALIISSLALLINWPLSLFRKMLEGKQEYVFTSGLVTIFAVIRFATIVLFLEKSNNALLFLIIVNFSFQILLNFIFAIYSFKSLSFLRLHFNLISKKVFKKIFSFSWVLFIIHICGMLVYSTDKIIIGIFLPISSMVLYEAAFKFHNLIRTINSLSSSAVIPAASSLNAKGDFTKIKKLFLQGSKYTTIIVLPCTVVIIVFAKYIINFWLGSDYNSVIFPMQLFVSYWALNCSFALGGSVLIAINKMKNILWYSICGAVGNLILSLILVSYMRNVVAVIWGTVIPYFIGYPIFLYFFLKLTKISFGEFINEIILKTYPYIGILAIIGILISRFSPPNNLIETILYMGILVLLYWGIVLFKGISVGEREDFRFIILDCLGIRRKSI